jgi:hypothetical protein
MRIPFACTVLGVIALAACSPDVTDIHAESTGPSGSGGHHTQGAGGASSSSSASSSGSGAGGNGVGAGRVITADTDSTRLVTGSYVAMGKLIDGPFVLTDAHASSSLSINLVSGATCDDQSQAKPVVGGGSVVYDAHGLRIFVPAGSSLCDGYGNPGVYSGFKPY